jgi:hypothetical protein
MPVNTRHHPPPIAVAAFVAVVAAILAGSVVVHGFWFLVAYHPALLLEGPFWSACLSLPGLTVDEARQVMAPYVEPVRHAARGGEVVPGPWFSAAWTWPSGEPVDLYFIPSEDQRLNLCKALVYKDRIRFVTSSMD